MIRNELRTFIADLAWIFAKTYADTYPHEYIVQERVDNDLFLELAEHIDSVGYERNFYSKPVIYWDYEGYTYWHMGNIINRCVEADKGMRRAMESKQVEIGGCVIRDVQPEWHCNECEHEW